MKKALIDKNGKVYDVVDQTFPISGKFYWLDCTADVEHGYIYKNGQFILPPKPEPSSPAEIMAHYEKRVDNYLDSTVQERQYKNIESACSYAVSENETYRREAQTCVVWRDAVWEKAYSILNAVMDDKWPDENDFLSRLPKLVWPDKTT